VIVVGYRIRPEDFRQHCYSLAAGDHYVRQTSVGHTQVVVTADGTVRRGGRGDTRGRDRHRATDDGSWAAATGQCLQDA